MAISITCSVNLPTSAIVTTSISRTPEIACPATERSWRSRCLLALMCAIVGAESQNFTAVAAASDPAPRIARIQRWSEKRSCQPWQLNSLETIVPENLPRPSAKRRWESTSFSAVEAPMLEATPRSAAAAAGCFTL